MTTNQSNRQVKERGAYDLPDNQDDPFNDRFVFQSHEKLPENSTLYPIDIIVERGKLTLQLNDQHIDVYPAGSIITVPAKTKMSLFNQFLDDLEVVLFKTPAA